MIATGRPARFEASRIFSIKLLWKAWSPWEKLSRAISSPARMSFSIWSTDLEEGPRVPTILTFLGKEECIRFFHLIELVFMLMRSQTFTIFGLGFELRHPLIVTARLIGEGLHHTFIVFPGDPVKFPF